MIKLADLEFVLFPRCTSLSPPKHLKFKVHFKVFSLHSICTVLDGVRALHLEMWPSCAVSQIVHNKSGIIPRLPPHEEWLHSMCTVLDGVRVLHLEM